MNRAWLVIHEKEGFENLLLDNRQRIEIEKSFARFYFKDGKWMVCLKEGFFNQERHKVFEIKEGVFTLQQNDLLYKKEWRVYETNEDLNRYSLYECADFEYREFDDRLFFEAKTGTLNASSYAYVNQKPYHGQKLTIGDDVRFYALHWVYLGDKILANRELPNERACSYRALKKIPFERKRSSAPLVFEPALKRPVCPTKPSVDRREKHHNLSFSSVVMSIAMAGAALINVSLALDQNRPYKQIISMAIFPLSMILSGLVIPMLISISEKRKEAKIIKADNERYTQETKRYEAEIKTFLQSQKRIAEEKTFSYVKALQNMKKDVVFNRPIRVDGFYLTLGYGEKPDAFFPEESDDHYPLFIYPQLQDIVCLWENEKDHHFYFRKWMNELHYSYHPDECRTVFVGEEDVFKDYFQFPHHYENGERFFFHCVEDALASVPSDDKLSLYFLINPKRLPSCPENAIFFCLFERKEDIQKYADKVVLADNGKGLYLGEERVIFRYDFCDNEWLFNETLLLPYVQKGTYIQTGIMGMKHLYGLRSVYDLDIASRYAHPLPGLKTRFATDGQRFMDLDLHEKGDGPHGLVGGFTGSGKSECLLAVLLGLAVNYPPDYCAFVLVDYKGGGLIDSLCVDGRPIPHLLAALDNLQEGSERFLYSLMRECRYRQECFKQLSQSTDNPINSLDDYNRFYQKGKDPQIPHLVVAVDEFAELKRQQPKFLTELISLSRIGRSLGIHLLLATQKPSSCIDDEIWSNSRFKIALKMQEERDSMELLHDKCAADLKDPGELYLLVDGFLRRGKAVYTRGDALSGEPKEVDLLSREGMVVAKKVYCEKRGESERSVICRLIQTASKPYVMKREIFMKKPVAVNEAEIRARFNLHTKNSELILGIEDNVVQGVQRPLIWDLKKGGLLCLGNRDNVHAFTTLLMKKPSAIIYIGSVAPKDGVTDFVSYKDEEEILVLLNRILAYPHVLNRFLIIEDLSVLLTMCETIKDNLYKVITRGNEKGLLIFAFCSRVNVIPYRYYGLFSGRTAYMRLDDEQMNNYMPNCVGGDCLFYEKTTLSFVPCIPESVHTVGDFKPFLPPGNRPLHACVCQKKILIGEDTKTRIKVFIVNTNVWITASEESFLEAYVSYKSLGVRVSAIKPGDSFDGFEHIVWVGPRLLAQRAVPLYIHEDVSEKEVMWIHGKKGNVLRALCPKM